MVAHIVHTDNVPPGSWEQSDDVNAGDLFLKRIPMLKSCPHFLRGRLREGFWIRAPGEIKGETRGRRCWRIASLEIVRFVAKMLLHRPRGVGSLGPDELVRRVDAFSQGRWTQLIDEAQQQELGGTIFDPEGPSVESSTSADGSSFGPEERRNFPGISRATTTTADATHTRRSVAVRPRTSSRAQLEGVHQMFEWSAFRIGTRSWWLQLRDVASVPRRLRGAPIALVGGRGFRGAQHLQKWRDSSRWQP